MNQNNGFVAALVCGVLFASLVGSCTSSNTNTSSSSSSNYTSDHSPKNDYQDMRNKGHSEEDAVIFSILKQQGYSDYEAVRATKASK